MGLSSDGGSVIQLYWIMGRSENSRNRVFCEDGLRVWTEPADPSRCADPSLIIYEAMLELDGNHIVSNGDQTRSVCLSLLTGGGFESALAVREREPDAPNFTPRITGMVSLHHGGPFYRFAVLKANRWDKAVTDRHFFSVQSIAAGCGLCLTTYKGDGKPLPSFEGEPFALPLAGGPEEVLETYWKALNAENRISLALKSIAIDTGKSKILLRNKLKKL